MKLEQFRYFITIDRLHSISAAARSYNIRQNTLSAIVKAAEEEFGIPIFQRTPNGVECTALGEQFLLLAREIDVKYGELLTLRKQVKSKTSVRILLDPVLNMALSIPTMSRFHQFNVRGNLRFEEADVISLVQRIMNGSTSVGVASLTSSHLNQLRERNTLDILTLLPLYEDQLYLITSPEHRLASHSIVRFADLQGERLALLQLMSHDIWNTLGNLFGRTLRVTVFSQNVHVTSAVLEQGMVGFVSRFILQSDHSLDRSRFRLIPIEPASFWENKIQICILYRKDRNLRYQEKLLIACIQEYFAELSAQECLTVSTERG